MGKQHPLGLCGLVFFAVLLGACSAIHRSEQTWECTGQATSNGRMSPYCTAFMTGHTAANLPSPVKKTGFSIELPKDAGWLVVRNTTTAIAIARVGKHSDESYVIDVQGSSLPDLATPQAFQQFVDMQRSENTDPKRFTILSNKETLVEKGPQGALCLRYDTTAIDHDAHTASGPETLYTTNAGLTCRSPYDPTLAVTVVYSYRYHPQDADNALPSKLDELISGFRFEPTAETTGGH